MIGGGLLGGHMLGMLGTGQQESFEEHWLSTRINYQLLPEHMRGSMLRWIEFGISGGSFMQAILANDLIQAACKADHVNSEFVEMRKFAHFLINEAPPGSYGSWEAVGEWERRGGLRGVNAQRVEQVTHEILRKDDDQISSQ